MARQDIISVSLSYHVCFKDIYKFSMEIIAVCISIESFSDLHCQQHLYKPLSMFKSDSITPSEVRWQQRPK